MRGDVCRIGDCKKLVTGKTGMVCSMHLARYWRSGGDFNYVSPNWTVSKKGKPQLNGCGYYRIHDGDKRVLQHRLIMEKHLGRKLRKNERVHHINGIKTDNRIENMIVLTQAQHMSEYHPKKPLIDWSKYHVTPPRKFNRWHPCKIKTCIVCGDRTKYAELCGKHYQSYRHNILGK